MGECEQPWTNASKTQVNTDKPWVNTDKPQVNTDTPQVRVNASNQTGTFVQASASV